MCVNGSDYMKLYLEYQKHYGLPRHVIDDVRGRYGPDADQLLDDFWHQLDLDRLAQRFEPAPGDVESIEDEDTVLGAWGRLGMPLNFVVFAAWTQRATTPTDPDFEPRLIPLVARDTQVNLAAAAGVRGTAYSCETCYGPHSEHSLGGLGIRREAHLTLQQARRRWLGRPSPGGLRDGSDVWRCGGEPVQALPQPTGATEIPQPLSAREVLRDRSRPRLKSGLQRKET
jgi:hypothetical protein